MLPVNFNSLSASLKLEHHCKMMKNTKYVSLPQINPDAWSLTKLTNKKALSQSFLNDTDERLSIQGKFKPIHTEGLSAPILFVPNSNNYTGLYNSGFSGILRLSRAVNSTPYTYGLALKAFVDEKPSVNFHAMYSLDGQGDDFDFFSNTFSTSIDPPKRTLLKIIAFFFHQSLSLISKDPNNRPINERFIPLIESASVKCDGSIIDSPIAPSKLLFVPTINLDTPNKNDFREQIINQVKSPSNLYKLYDEKNILLGNITLLDDFIASSHGDNMHFKHQQVSGSIDKCIIYL
jgi:hypothetical protein